MNPLTTLAVALVANGLAACGQADSGNGTSPVSQTTTPATIETTTPVVDAASASEAITGVAATLTPEALAAIDPAAAFAGYDALLRARVDDLGFVDYTALAPGGAEHAALRAYVDSLAVPTLFNGQSRDAKLATLMNAYNAFTLQLIVDNFKGGTAPKSITDLHGGKPWDQKIWNLAGQTVSLNQIEHEMIRAEFPEEPRIHWAVVCAALSCPPLRAEAYTAADLETQLVDQERRVLLAGDGRFIQSQGNHVTGLTKLFEWYGSDFGDPWAPYVENATSLSVSSPKFIDYDWKLNSQPNRPAS